jgi:16S rRNA (cytidine1402-2'-O)-methyltransferase
VVAGAQPAQVVVTPAEAAVAVADREKAGESRKEAIAAVARAVGLPRRAVYDAVVARVHQTSGSAGVLP